MRDSVFQNKLTIPWIVPVARAAQGDCEIVWEQTRKTVMD